MFDRKPKPMFRQHLDTKALNAAIKPRGDRKQVIGTQVWNITDLEELLAQAKQNNRQDIWLDVYLACDNTTGDILLTRRGKHIKCNIRPQLFVRPEDLAVDDSSLQAIDDSQLKSDSFRDAWEDE